MPVSSSSTRYRRAAPMDPEEQAEAESKKIRAERIDKILAKIHAVVWVLVSIALFIVTDTINLLRSSDNINRCGRTAHPIPPASHSSARSLFVVFSSELCLSVCLSVCPGRHCTWASRASVPTWASAST